MPLGDVAYVDAALDAVVGSWPSTGANYHLFVSDPNLETTPLDVELTSGGGYVAVAFVPSAWASADSRSKSTSAAVDFGFSTGPFDDVATFWGVVDSTGKLVYSDELDTPITVDVSGTEVTFTPTLTFTDAA